MPAFSLNVRALDGKDYELSLLRSAQRTRVCPMAHSNSQNASDTGFDSSSASVTPGTFAVIVAPHVSGGCHASRSSSAWSFSLKTAGHTKSTFQSKRWAARRLTRSEQKIFFSVVQNARVGAALRRRGGRKNSAADGRCWSGRRSRGYRLHLVLTPAPAVAWLYRRRCGWGTAKAFSVGAAYWRSSSFARSRAACLHHAG